MKNFLVLIILWLAIWNLAGKELIVTEFYESDNYEIQEIYDVNGELCAVVSLEYDLDEEVIFADIDLYKRVEHEDEKRIDFYLSKWETAVTIVCQGFLPLKYRFHPVTLQAGKGYSMGIKANESSGYYLGSVFVSPKPVDAEVRLIRDDQEICKQGICSFNDLDAGGYSLLVTHESCLPWSKEFELARKEKKEFTPRLTDTSYYFKFTLPEYLKGILDIEIQKCNNGNPDEVIQPIFVEDKCITGEAGDFYLTLLKDGQKLYQTRLSIFAGKCPEIKLNYCLYDAPSKNCKLIVNNVQVDSGEKLCLISEYNQEFVKINIPDYSDLEFKEDFTNSGIRNLQLGKDYFSRGGGISLASNCNKKFYGIKLPLIYSPKYYAMNGIELNIWSAGNNNGKPGSGYFSGIAVAGFSTSSSSDYNGIAISGLLTTSGGDLNGLAFGGLITMTGKNLNGLSIGSINITQQKTTGLQIGLINFAHDLRGVQIGLINYVDDGKGGALPCLPLINMKFWGKKK